jgi:single-strand DNA-binding protein
MANFNFICIAGNLTYKPELSYTPAGVAVAKMRLAVNESWTDRDGKEVKDTLFIDVTVWKKQAETVTQYLEKGSGCLVAGKLKLNVWTSPDGEKHKKFLIVANKVVFLGKPNLQKIDEMDEKRAGPPPDPDAGQLPIEEDGPLCDKEIPF